MTMQDIETREPEDTEHAEELVSGQLLIEDQPAGSDAGDPQLRAIIEAIIYIADEPLSVAQIASALQQPAADVLNTIQHLTAEYSKPEHGLTIRELAGGYKMA